MVQRVAAIDLAAVHCAAADEVAATLTPFLLADDAVIADTPPITQPGAAQISAGAVTSGLPPCAAGVLPRSSSPKTVPADGFFCTTPTQRANAPLIEAGLEGILRDQKRCVKRSWFFLFRVHGVHTRDIFCGLDDTDSGFRTVCKEGFGVDTDKGFTHRVGRLASCIACTAAVAHREATTGVDAIQNVQGEPVVVLAADSHGLIDQFLAKCDMHLHDQLLALSILL